MCDKTGDESLCSSSRVEPAVSSAICGKESTETSRSLVTPMDRKIMVLQTAECLTGDAEPKPVPAVPLLAKPLGPPPGPKTPGSPGRPTMTVGAALSGPPPGPKIVPRANSRCCVWCSACWSPTTSRRNLKQQFFERGVRFIRFWLRIDCRMTRHFVNFVTYVAASGEPKAAPKPVPGPPSGDPPPGTCWAHVPSILIQVIFALTTLKTQTEVEFWNRAHECKWAMGHVR